MFFANSKERIMSFRILGLPAEAFSHLFALSDQELAERNAIRAPAPSEVPCRVSLTDAEPGEEVLLVNFEHHPVDTPYRSSFAIYVRKGETTYDAVDSVPAQLRRRMLSVRGYDGRGMMLDNDLVDGRELEGAIERQFADSRTAYLQLHFAKPGCYAARVERA
jgi:Protein of unknown function (DUF1203)